MGFIKALADNGEFAQERHNALHFIEKVFAETSTALFPYFHRSRQLALGRRMKAGDHFFSVERSR